MVYFRNGSKHFRWENHKSNSSCNSSFWPRSVPRTSWIQWLSRPLHSTIQRKSLKTWILNSLSLSTTNFGSCRLKQVFSSGEIIPRCHYHKFTPSWSWFLRSKGLKRLRLSWRRPWLRKVKLKTLWLSLISRLHRTQICQGTKMAVKNGSLSSTKPSPNISKCKRRLLLNRPRQPTESRLIIAYLL